MGKVAAWQRALSSADVAEADGPASPSTDGWSSVSSMRSTHEAERLSATPTPLVGCTHDSALVRATATAARCSRLSGALQLGEGRGALPMRVVHRLWLCAAADADRKAA